MVGLFVIKIKCKLYVLDELRHPSNSSVRCARSADRRQSYPLLESKALPLGLATSSPNPCWVLYSLPVTLFRQRRPTSLQLVLHPSSKPQLRDAVSLSSIVFTRREMIGNSSLA